MAKFIIRLLALTFIIAIAVYLLKEAIPSRYYYSNFPVLLGFFIIVTVAFHAGLEKSYRKGSKEFIRYYMGATGAKLFLYLIIIIAYAMVNKENTVAFVTSFLLFYIIYTVFEVANSMHHFGPKKTEAVK